MKIIVKTGFLKAGLIFALTTLMALSACGQLPDYRNLDQVDIKPPRITGIVPTGELGLKISFDEPLSDDSELTLSPNPGIESISLDVSELTVKLVNPQETGSKYAVKGIVRDRNRNSLTFLYYFYGYNPSPPEILINEFTTQGSGNHPDVVELKVVEGGNLGGLEICEGTADYHEDSFIFPSVSAEKGEYILVHFKPEGIPEEVNETVDKKASGGLDASMECLDFWVPGGNGLGGNNGTLTLYARPGGPLLDGVLYSNRTSASDTDYRGFGSRKVMNMADQLFEEGGWNTAGDKPVPEDAVNPEDSTATRSICRTPEKEDTGTSGDWHITPTGGYSFGNENSGEIYTPD